MLAKIGPRLHRERAARLVEDLRADDVGRQQVGRELDAVERGVDRLGQRAHRERLGQAGHALEQHVTAGEQADQQALDHVLLADDAPRDLLKDALDERRVRHWRSAQIRQFFRSLGFSSVRESAVPSSPARS